jgi:excisionase family DNA binding protein
MTGYLSVAEAAALVRVSPWTVRWWLTNGRLQRFKAGGRTLIAEADLEAFVRLETSAEATARNTKRTTAARANKGKKRAAR